MMEFTFDGLVRHGFGFYNPNHAAALLSAVFPFLWGWKRVPVLGWLLSVAQTVPLALTYSRTGILVLAFELVAFFFFSRPRSSRKAFFVLFGALLAVALLVGVGARFTLDRAVLNRPEIGLAGLKLAAANPLGVGFGHSGELASIFLLDGIVCRTLAQTVWLFGAMAEYAPLFPSASLVFVSPPEFFELPFNTERVFLKKYAESRDADSPTTFY